VADVVSGFWMRNVRLSWHELTSRLQFPSCSLIEIRLRGVRLGERDGQAVLSSHPIIFAGQICYSDSLLLVAGK
jgi:hypothetical protein